MEDILTADSFWEEFSPLTKERPKAFPRREQISVYEQLDSTNAELLRRMEAASALRDVDGSLTADGRNLHLSVVVAASQTAGRGRVGRSFYSPEGTGIYFSLLYAPRGGVKDPAAYTVTAAVGVCRAIEALYGVQAQIKWVNDVYVHSRKVCGILTEGFSRPGTGIVEAAIIGIGINIVVDETKFPSDAAAKAGGILDGGRIEGLSRARLLARAVKETLAPLAAGEDVVPEYRRRSLLLGKKVMVSPLAGTADERYEAEAIAVTDDAGLLVELADGSRRVLRSGEVTLHL